MKAHGELKLLRKHEEDQVRLLKGWEVYRALWDGIDFKRQLINMGDKKVRFALVIMGAINAAMLVVVTRGRVLDAIPDWARPWVAGLLVLYAIVTFSMVVHAIEALRPRPEARVPDNKEWLSREEGAGAEAESRAGLIIRGRDLRISFEDERRLWHGARLTDLNDELILFNRSSSVVLISQLEALEKVYTGLKVLAILAAIILVLLLGGTILNSSALS